MENKLLEIVKNNPNIRKAVWTNKDEWDSYTCSECGYNGGYIEERFCAKCGCFMLNREPDTRYHYFCSHCGASLDAVSCTISPASTAEEQQMRFTCPECGETSVLTFADAQVEYLHDEYEDKLIEIFSK